MGICKMLVLPAYGILVSNGVVPEQVGLRVRREVDDLKRDAELVV